MKLPCGCLFDEGLYPYLLTYYTCIKYDNSHEKMEIHLKSWSDWYKSAEKRRETILTSEGNVSRT